MTLFNKQREAGRLSQQEKNRHEETAVLETLERDLEVKEGDNPWSRVARLVEMVSKATLHQGLFLNYPRQVMRFPKGPFPISDPHLLLPYAHSELRRQSKGRGLQRSYAPDTHSPKELVSLHREPRCKDATEYQLGTCELRDASLRLPVE